MVKQKLTLSIDKEIITQAKKQQINLSSFLEIRLIDHMSDKEICSRREGSCNLLVKKTDYIKPMVGYSNNPSKPQQKKH